jgi:hypothetical protein
MLLVREESSSQISASDGHTGWGVNTRTAPRELLGCVRPLDLPFGLAACVPTSQRDTRRRPRHWPRPNLPMGRGQSR